MGDIGETYDPPVHPLRSSSLFARPARTPGSSTREYALRKRIERDQAALAELEIRRERFGAEPAVGTTIVFVKAFDKPSPLNGRTRYPYAALRTETGWYLTGRETGAKSWDELTEFIGDGEFVAYDPPAKFAEWTSPFAGLAGIADKLRNFPKFKVISDPRMPTGVLVVMTEGEEHDHVHVSVDPAWVKPRRDPLAPFAAMRVPDARPERWQVVRWSDDYSDAYETVRSFGGGAGQIHAIQSAAARNAAYQHDVLTLKVEPPVGARVRAKSNHRIWARREPNGWTRYNGTTVQGVRLSFDTVRYQLGPMEPGTQHSLDLFPGDE